MDEYPISPNKQSSSSTVKFRTLWRYFRRIYPIAYHRPASSEARMSLQKPLMRRAFFWGGRCVVAPKCEHMTP